MQVRSAGCLRVMHPHLTISKIESEEEPTYPSACPADEPDITQALSSVAHCKVMVTLFGIPSPGGRVRVHELIM